MNASEIKDTLINSFLKGFPFEGADMLSKASDDEILNFLQKLPIGTAREIFINLDRDISSTILMEMNDTLFVELFKEMDAFAAALILSRTGKKFVDRKLLLLPDGLTKEIKELITYPEDSAGFLMDFNFSVFYMDNTVKDVLKKLRLLKDKKMTTIYVMDREGRLTGKIPIQVIAISSTKMLLQDLTEETKAVHVMAPREEVVEIFKGGNQFTLPVIDLDNKLLGVIRNESLLEATQQDASEDVQAMFGAGREERALSKVGFAVKKRLPWLEINLATAFLAAAVVGIFEDTIAQITVLAVFLPVVAGQSGNTGSQALAVTMRGLALREIRPSQWLKIARKEAAVGFINGVAVALTTSIIVYIWASSFGLALIIAVSMVISMVIAGFSGAIIPIFLKSIGQDPAQSSSIVLTTITDIVGFISFLGLATALGSMLGIL